MGIVTSLIQYVVIMVILAAIAVGGVFVGKALRTRSDENKAKEQDSNTVEE